SLAALVQAGGSADSADVAAGHPSESVVVLGRAVSALLALGGRRQSGVGHVLRKSDTGGGDSAGEPRAEDGDPAAARAVALRLLGALVALAAGIAAIVFAVLLVHSTIVG